MPTNNRDRLASLPRHLRTDTSKTTVGGLALDANIWHYKFASAAARDTANGTRNFPLGTLVVLTDTYNLFELTSKDNTNRADDVWTEWSSTSVTQAVQNAGIVTIAGGTADGALTAGTFSGFTGATSVTLARGTGANNDTLVVAGFAAVPLTGSVVALNGVVLIEGSSADYTVTRTNSSADTTITFVNWRFPLATDANTVIDNLAVHWVS